MYNYVWHAFVIKNLKRTMCGMHLSLKTQKEQYLACKATWYHLLLPSSHHYRKHHLHSLSSCTS